MKGKVSLLSLLQTYPVYGTFFSIVMIYFVLKRAGWVEHRPKFGAFLLASPYFLFSVPRIFLSPPVVDELRFIKFAEEYGLHDFSLVQMFYAPNLEGFGGLWWSLESLSFQIWESFLPNSSTFSTIASLRFLSILCVTVWLGALFYLTIQGAVEQKLVALLAALTPMVWWSGKLASPELVSASLLGIGVFLLIRRKFLFSSILLGVAVGIKISAIAPVIAICSYLVFGKDKEFNLLSFYSKLRFFVVLSCCFIGSNAYIFSNPSSFFRLSRRVNPIITGQLPSEGFKETVIKILIQDEMHWDFVSRNGLTYWIGGLATSAIVVFLLVTAHRKSFNYIVVLSLGIVILSLVLANGLDFPWYYFPTIFLIFTLLASTTSGLTTKIPYSHHLSKALIVLVVVSSLTSASRENSQNMQYIQDYREFEIQRSCIQEKILSLRSDMEVYSMIFPAEELALGGAAENTWEAGLWLSDPKDKRALFVVGARGESALTRSEKVSFQLLSRCGHYSFIVGQRSDV
jgi:hypothetical protein